MHKLMSPRRIGIRSAHRLGIRDFLSIEEVNSLGKFVISGKHRPKHSTFQEEELASYNSKDFIRIPPKAEIYPERNGLFEFYWAKSGKLALKGLYVKGKKEGYWEYFSRHGKITSKGEYLNHEKVGCWHYYTKLGKLKKCVFYAKEK